MNVQIKSIFEQVSVSVFSMTNLVEAKKFIIDFVCSKNIKQSDKDIIISKVTQQKSLIKLQEYICNSLLQYEGLSVNRKINEVVD